MPWSSFPRRHRHSRASVVILANAGIHFDHRKAGIGSISETFDAEEPFRPGGCIAQAWSIAEVLRAWLTTRSG